MNCPRSSVDRAVASGAMCAGSTPAGGTMSVVKGETLDENFLHSKRYSITRGNYETV